MHYIRFIFRDGTYGHLDCASLSEAQARVDTYRSINQNIVDYVIFDANMHVVDSSTDLYPVISDRTVTSMRTM